MLSSPACGACRIDAEREAGGAPKSPRDSRRDDEFLSFLSCREELFRDSTCLDKFELLSGVFRTCPDKPTPFSGVDASGVDRRCFPGDFPRLNPSPRDCLTIRPAASSTFFSRLPKPISCITACKHVPLPLPGDCGRLGLRGLRPFALGVPIWVPSLPRLLGVPIPPSGCTFLPLDRARNSRLLWSTAHPRVSMPVPVRLGGRGKGVLPALAETSSEDAIVETGIVLVDVRNLRTLPIRRDAHEPPAGSPHKRAFAHHTALLKTRVPVVVSAATRPHGVPTHGVPGRGSQVL